MNSNLSRENKADLLRRGFTRRSFGRISTLLGAGGALSFYNEFALAQLSRIGPLPPGAVKINANENPLGPCPEALEAVHQAARNGGRYQYEDTFTFARTLAETEGLDASYVAPFAGSSDPLHRTILAYTSPTRSLVMGEPGYEAGERAARFVGAPVNKVPLTSDYRHDVKAMVKADPNAGVIYICNPNNPTGTVTPRADLEYVLQNKPAGSILLLDEAYIHFTDEPCATDLVAQGKDLIILRTFSKLYGMAGLRAGAAIGRPDLLEKIRSYGAGALPSTGMAAATASLNSKNLVAQRRKLTQELREEQFAFLSKHGIEYVPSVSTKFMMKSPMPASDLIQALAAEKIYIGRIWKVWPNHVRVSIGTAEEMEKFQKALLKVLS